MLNKLKLYRSHSKAFRDYINGQGEIYKNRWLFSSADNVEFNYNSKYLFEYVVQRHPEITPYYVINDEDKRRALNEEYETEAFINTRTQEGQKKALSCKTWFTSASLPIYARGLAQYYDIINLWHGIPLKRIALADRNMGFFGRLYFREIFSRNYKYILTSSEALIPVMQKSFDVPRERIKVWGQPRCDLLYRKNDAGEILRSLYGRLPEANRVILYAPTYRDQEQTRLFPFADFNKDTLFQYLKGSKTLILVKPHRSEKADFSEYFGEYVLPLNIPYDIMDIFNIFDMLITDYSSIYIDYLKLDRGIVFLPYDKESYMRNRGLNFPYDEVTPGVKPRNLKEFINALKGVEDDYYSMKRREVLELLDTTTGEVSESICRNILEEAKSIKKGDGV